jgi:hypothetical protein
MDQRPWKEPPASKVAAADLSEPQLPLLSMGRESTTHPFSSELAQGFKFYRDFGCWFWKLRVSLKQQERLLETLVVTSL